MDTSKVQVPAEIVDLIEVLARNTHDTWAKQRLAEGWTYGEHRDDSEKKHPGMVPYDQLSESEKNYDRNTAMETIKVILSLGYQIHKDNRDGNPTWV